MKFRFQLLDDRAAAMIEFAICAPFLALLILGVIDVAGSMQQHQVMKAVAYEGARLGAGLAQLEIGLGYPASTFYNLHLGTPCLGGAPATNCPNQQFMHTRMNQLLTLHDLHIANLDIRTGYLPTQIGTYDPIRDTVDVTIRGRFDGLLPALQRNISVQARAPYLFSDKTTTGVTIGGIRPDMGLWGGYTAGEIPPDL